MPLYPDFHRLYKTESELSEGPRCWLPLHERGFVVRKTGETVTLLDETTDNNTGTHNSNGDNKVRETFSAFAPRVLGHYNGATYLTCALPTEMELPEGCEVVELRKLYGLISEVEWQIAGYASQVLHWEQTSGFCPVCGHAMGAIQKEWMRQCPHCAYIRYPTVSPAVLMLVHDGADRVLLAHKAGWGDRYSILAGFVLPGESLEDCVTRETEEEVGVQVTDLVYQGSQPWPFPHQLMVGFTARYVSGDIRIEEEELDHAAWFAASELPSLPPPLSLSRQIIDRWQASVS